MKIAIVTMDGNTVSQHFGRSPYYKILTIEDNQVTGEEMRRRGTGHFAPQQQNAAPHHEEQTHSHPEGKHGYGSDADMKHASMAQEIGDCKVLVAGGMGQGAYESFKRAGLDVIMTNHQSINEVVDSYIKGELKDLSYGRTD